MHHSKKRVTSSVFTITGLDLKKLDDSHDRKNHRLQHRHRPRQEQQDFQLLLAKYISLMVHLVTLVRHQLSRQIVKI